ncbi:hypothetical protein QYF36_013451 [Acer negundo]|nr:hypothetical protein QYF36_013451 [Acer negundo]
MFNSNLCELIPPLDIHKKPIKPFLNVVYPHLSCYSRLATVSNVKIRWLILTDDIQNQRSRSPQHNFTTKPNPLPLSRVILSGSDLDPACILSGLP